MFINAYRQRTCTFTVSLFDADGALVEFSGDVIRLKIGRKRATPILDLDSVAASANGSTVSAGNPTTVRLDQADLDFTAGSYDLEVGLVDDSDSDALKHAQEGVFHLNDTMTGDLGDT